MDSKDKKNFTPLHLSAVNGRIETMKILLSRGAEKDAQTDFKKTPLHFAGIVCLILRKCNFEFKIHTYLLYQRLTFKIIVCKL